MVTVCVLGAGPAGLGAALLLARRGHEVTVFERASEPGGLAASFEVAGVRVDHGSHRLHRSCPPEILDELRAELGDDLQLRQRNGRIRLAGRWVAFPPSPGDLIRRLPPGLSARLAADIFGSPFRRARDDTFAEVVRAGLGRTMLDELYAPYVQKIWGIPASGLSGELARRRVGAGSWGTLLRRVLQPGERRRRTTFWYPKRGFGQIPEALAAAATRAGARVVCDAEVTALDLAPDEAKVTTADGVVAADQVWSTLPLPVAARLAHAPADVLDAAGSLRYRALTLVYLAFDRSDVTALDASYFPALDVCASRVSEPKHYRDGVGSDPVDRTVLCAEVPCAVDDDVWRASDDTLATRLVKELAAQDMPLPAPIEVVTRRVSQAYPMYAARFEAARTRVDAWALDQPRFVSLGRQGLFAHDNTHHALATAWSAAEALLGDGRIDPWRWAEAREQFAAHVVED